MKTLAILLMMAQEVEFKPVDQLAKVCRTHMTTHHKQCSKPMNPKDAHLIVLSRDKAEREWAYSYEPVVPAKPYNAGCITLTDMGVGGVKP